MKTGDVLRLRTRPTRSPFSAPTEGVVQFHVSVKVDMNEFEGWQPERIAAFFGGIAQVLSAKGAIERSTTAPGPSVPAPDPGAAARRLPSRPEEER